MSWEHFAHDADIGVRGRGATLAGAFEQAALALTAVVTDPRRVPPAGRVDVRCEAPDAEILLVDWLNALIYEMATRRHAVRALRGDDRRRRAAGGGLGRAAGPDRATSRPSRSKGATYTALAVGADRAMARGWRSASSTCERGRCPWSVRDGSAARLIRHRRVRVAAAAGRRDARAGRHLRRRGADPRHGREGPAAGRQRRDAAGHREGVLRDARRALGLRLPDRRRGRVRSGRTAASCPPAAWASTSPAACARCSPA